MNLLLSPGILELLIQHAKKAYPNEGCGLLVGRYAAERFIPMKNVSAFPSSEYEMDPPELIHVLRDLRSSVEQLFAIYHSHPAGAAQLSRTDIERSYYPEAAHLIISLADLDHPQAAAFRVIDGAALAVEVHAIV